MTKEQAHTPGKGCFECDDDGLVIERFPDGSVSFDIFDASLWPGLDEEGLTYARLITDTVAERDQLVVANAELVTALKAMVCGTRDPESVERARALIARHGGGA